MSNPFDRPPYLDKLGLNEPPYTTNPDERFLFMTDDHNEAIHMCGRVISNREGIGLIVGEKGTGKTTIMRRLNSTMMDHGGFSIALVETAEHCPTIFQLVKDVLESYGEECVGRDTKTRTDQLKDFLFKSYQEQKSCILLIDEAQQMTGRMLESIRGLLNFEEPALGGKLLQIILFAMPAIHRKLKHAPSLRNRLVMTQLNLMSVDEVHSMLKWRYITAGGQSFPFESDAIKQLHALTRGNPRLICGIAQMAIEIAGMRGDMVAPGLIRQIADRRMLD